MASVPSSTAATCALRKEGNDLFAKAEWRAALSKYAAALAALPPVAAEASDEEQKLMAKFAAALRANRAVCCSKLGDHELALAEAEKCVELQPEWPKGFFRKASALQALGRLGDARLALGDAARLAPADTDIATARTELRDRLFKSALALRVGVALDVLENFDGDPTATVEAAKELHSLLKADTNCDVEGTDLEDCANRADCIQAFVSACGAATLFRRQNAMGPHWRDECKNGTMSLLSQIAASAPQLELELVALNRKAEAYELGCGDGSAACPDRPRAQGGSAEFRQAIKKTSAAKSRGKRGAGARPLSTACDFSDMGFAQIDPASKPDPFVPPERSEFPPPPPVPEPFVPEPPPAPTITPDKRETTTGPENQLAACQPLVQKSSDGSNATSALLSQVEDQFPGFSEALRRVEPQVRDDSDSVRCSEDFLQRLLAKSSTPETKLLKVPTSSELLPQWMFLVSIGNSVKTMWNTTLAATHVLNTASATSAAISPTVFECTSVVPPGSDRRAMVTAAIAGLASAAEVGRTPEGLVASVTAVHPGTGRTVTLPAAIVPGSRCAVGSQPPVLSTEACASPPVLRAVVGWGARHVLPGARQVHPVGSLEVRVGLAFVGPDCSWVSGHSLALPAFLEAASAWNELNRRGGP